LVAYGVSEGGSEKSTLRVREVETGRDLPDVIPWTRACSLEWRPDGSGFFYTRYPEPGRVPPGEEDYHRQVFEHSLGEDWRRDALLFGEGREPEDWPSIHLSPDGRFLAVSVSRGWTRTDVYLQDRARGGGFVPAVEGIDSLFGVTLRNDRLYLHTNHGAPRYRLVAADPERPGAESWQDVIPEGPEVLEGPCWWASGSWSTDSETPPRAWPSMTCGVAPCGSSICRESSPWVR
jgi:prolyl oligopeptidase